MPKHPTLTDKEIRATLEAYRGHHGRWPTNKEARNVLRGPAANERLARILSNLRQQAEPAVSPRPADDSRTRRERLKAVFDDMTDEIGGPRLVAYEILRTDFMAAIEETRQDCLATDLALHCTLQEKLRAAEMAQRNFLSAHEDLRQMVVSASSHRSA